MERSSKSGPDLSILVVSFNTREMTLACLRSLYEETSDPEFEVLVVDNASADSSAPAIAAEFPQLQLIASSENLGFAGANNLAARSARGRRILLLNPDTVVLDEGVSRLFRFAEENPEARVWGGRTLFADGTLNPRSCAGEPTLWGLLCFATGLARIFRKSPRFNPEGLGGWGRDTVRQVPIISGCFLMVDRALWEELGGFDERYFMYGEDTDLCLRALARGARPLVTPTAQIVHHGGGSEPVRHAKVGRLFSAKVQLMRRHWPSWKAGVGSCVLRFHVLVRVLAFGAKGVRSSRARAAAKEWRQVWRGRAGWLEPPDVAARPEEPSPTS